MRVWLLEPSRQASPGNVSYSVTFCNSQPIVQGARCCLERAPRAAAHWFVHAGAGGPLSRELGPGCTAPTFSPWLSVPLLLQLVHVFILSLANRCCKRKQSLCWTEAQAENVCEWLTRRLPRAASGREGKSGACLRVPLSPRRMRLI